MQKQNHLGGGNEWPARYTIMCCCWWCWCRGVDSDGGHSRDGRSVDTDRLRADWKRLGRQVSGARWARHVLAVRAQLPWLRTGGRRQEHQEPTETWKWRRVRRRQPVHDDRLDQFRRFQWRMGVLNELVSKWLIYSTVVFWEDVLVGGSVVSARRTRARVS